MRIEHVIVDKSYVRMKIEYVTVDTSYIIMKIESVTVDKLYVRKLNCRQVIDSNTLLSTRHRLE